MMCRAIFAVSANGNRIPLWFFPLQFYDSALTGSKCLGVEGSGLGVGRGLVFPKPGKRKLAGEMLLDAFKPPHPVRSSPAIGRSTSQIIFRSNLTGIEYR